MERGRKDAAAPNARFVSTRATGSYSDGKGVALSRLEESLSLSLSCRESCAATVGKRGRG